MENWTLEFKDGGAWVNGYLFIPSDWETWRDEAHLIHAAPDLLAACEMAALEETNPHILAVLQAAIAKAKGE